MANSDKVKPFAIADRIKNAQRLTAIDGNAQKRGIRSGETVSDARARVLELEIFPADVEADQALLAGIADWCDRYTPLVALDGLDGLMLDISGCSHLFGGEVAMTDDLSIRLKRQGFAVQVAVADTPGAAWAVARYGGGGIIASDKQQQAIENLPVAALNLDENLVDEISRVGLQQIRDIIARPRAPLVNRFGVELLNRLDQALGDERIGISPRLVAPICVAEHRFSEPIAYEKDIKHSILSLAKTLAKQLEGRGEGARALELVLFRVDGTVSRLIVGTSRPVREPNHFVRLFAEKLTALGDEFDAGFGFDLIRLSAIEAQQLAPVQVDMTGQVGTEEELACLIDRLSTRLGVARVARFLPHETHLPERRSSEVPAALVKENELYWSGESRPGTNQPLERPVRLFEHPEPVETIASVPEGPPLRFRWRKALYEVDRVEGPERIASEWWHTDQNIPTRDYYRVEDQRGFRFWIFREGLYDQEVESPRWFMHGIFS